MLADNLTLFQSQMGDIQDLKGFDPNSSLAMDQSINIGPGEDSGNVPFVAAESVVHNSYRKSTTALPQSYQPPDQLIQHSQNDDIKPHPNQNTAETFARSNSMAQPQSDLNLENDGEQVTDEQTPLNEDN